MSAKFAVVAGLVATIIAAAMGLGLMQFWLEKHKLPGIKSEVYYAVLLNGGQAYFGKIKDSGNGYFVLTEVHYVQTRVNPETKESTNILIKRGKEVHAPTEMIINTSHVQSVEPVGADSQISKLVSGEGQP